MKLAIVSPHPGQTGRTPDCVDMLNFASRKHRHNPQNADFKRQLLRQSEGMEAELHRLERQGRGQTEDAAVCHMNIGGSHPNLEKSLHHLRQAYTLFEAFGNTERLAEIHHLMGLNALLRKKPDEAVSNFNHALQQYPMPAEGQTGKNRAETLMCKARALYHKSRLPGQDALRVDACFNIRQALLQLQQVRPNSNLLYRSQIEKLCEVLESDQLANTAFHPRSYEMILKFWTLMTHS